MSALWFQSVVSQREDGNVITSPPMPISLCLYALKYIYKLFGLQLRVWSLWFYVWPTLGRQSLYFECSHVNPHIHSAVMSPLPPNPHGKPDLSVIKLDHNTSSVWVVKYAQDLCLEALCHNIFFLLCCISQDLPKTTHMYNYQSYALHIIGLSLAHVPHIVVPLSHPPPGQHGAAEQPSSVTFDLQADLPGGSCVGLMTPYAIRTSRPQERHSLSHHQLRPSHFI